MKNKNNKKEYKTLLSVLAQGATDEAQKVLVENGLPEATTYEELEFNLAKAYSNTNDKIALERKFAEIHPHSAFILKYLAPKKTEEVEKDIESEDNKPTVVELTSNASGDCGCSSAEGATIAQSQQGNQIHFNTLALVSIVAIFGLVIISRQKA